VEGGSSTFYKLRAIVAHNDGGKSYLAQGQSRARRAHGDGDVKCARLGGDDGGRSARRRHRALNWLAAGPRLVDGEAGTYSLGCGPQRA
jgi:hypothetical protein